MRLSGVRINDGQFGGVGIKENRVGESEFSIVVGNIKDGWLLGYKIGIRSVEDEYWAGHNWDFYNQIGGSE